MTTRDFKNILGMTKRNFKISPDRLTNEFDSLLEFMERELSQELPTITLDIDYFIFAALRKKDNLLYKFIDKNMNSDSIKIIEDGYYKLLSSKMLKAVKPDRQILYDELFNAIIESTDEEVKNLGQSEDTKISTLHMFLAILANEDDDNKVRKLFAKSLCKHDIAVEKVKDFIIKYGDTYDDEYEEAVPDEEAPNSDEPTIQIIDLNDPNTTMDPSVARDIISRMQGRMNAASERPKKKQSYIAQYCTNLNEQAESGNMDKIIGRERETQEIIRVLGRKHKNSVILLGGEGVGKTAIGENIAYKIVNNDVPMFLSGKQLVSLDMTALMAGTTLRGMFEERVKGLLDEIKKDENTILFIDNIGAVLADNGKQDYDVSSMISRAVEVGDCQIIGTSDFKSFRKTFDKNPSLARRFQKIVVEPSSKEDARSIVFGLRPSYESFHKVSYTDEATNACVDLAAKYITDRNLPDSAIDVLDEVGSFIGTVQDDEELKDAATKLREMREDISTLKASDKYKEADALADELLVATRNYGKLKEEREAYRKENPKVVNVEDVLDVISNKTGIPVNQLSSDDKKKLSEIDKRLKSEVIGQDEAIDTICKALKRNRVGLHKNGCLYSLMSIGKTGTGKTLIAKKLAKEMFGTEKALVRFDMSEYPDKSAVNKLIGSNPGYVGYEEGGQLTEAVKNNKYCVLLLDEIEKADPEVYNIFLQVLDEGFLTDNSGMKVDFSNVIVIFTSNVGAKAANDFGKGVGFDEDVEDNTKRILNKELKKKFPPEFLNRLDNVIYFNSLTDDNLRDIIKIELGKLSNKLEELKYKLEFNEDTVNYILSVVSKDKDFGARPIARAIQDNIEDKITDIILERDLPESYMFKVSCSNDNELVVE